MRPGDEPRAGAAPRPPPALQRRLIACAEGRPGEEPDNATIKAAAAIAAWHSKKREARQVGVSGTRARYVTKPRGAKPGTVEIRKEKVFTVRPAIPE